MATVPLFYGFYGDFHRYSLSVMKIFVKKPHFDVNWRHFCGKMVKIMSKVPLFNGFYGGFIDLFD